MCVYVCIFLTYVQLIIYKNPEHNTRNNVLLWEKKQLRFEKVIQNKPFLYTITNTLQYFRKEARISKCLLKVGAQAVGFIDLEQIQSQRNLPKNSQSCFRLVIQMKGYCWATEDVMQADCMWQAADWEAETFWWIYQKKLAGPSSGLKIFRRSKVQPLTSKQCCWISPRFFLQSLPTFWRKKASKTC